MGLLSFPATENRRGGDIIGFLEFQFRSVWFGPLRQRSGPLTARRDIQDFSRGV